MTVADKYQFFLEFPSAGTIEVFPVNDTLQWEWRKVDGHRYHRRELVTKLTFCNDHRQNIKDFDPWYVMERAKQRCDKVNLVINAKCDTAFEEHYKGKAAILDAEFDAGICRVDVKFEPDDDYACIHNNWEKEENILPRTPPQIAEVFVGQIEVSERCFVLVPGSRYDSVDRANFPNTLITQCSTGSTIPANEAWTPWRVFFVWVSNNDPQNPDQGIWEMEMQYVRERVDSATTPPGYGWIDTGDGFVRPLATKLTVDNVSVGLVQREYEAIFPVGVGFDNGRFLNDILVYFFTKYCNLPLVSNFFGINPDATNPSNAQYTKALAVFQELMVFAKGDIIRHNADENNTILNMTLKKLLEMLKIIFNVEYQVINDTIYLEHFSYFAPDLGLDLTADKYLPCIEDHFKWTYAKEEIPSRETFEWEEKTDEGSISYDFDARPIEYTIDCDVDGDVLPHRADVVMTNVTALVEDGDPENWNITSNSFVLLATLGGDIIREPGALSGTPHLNGSLAWANLIPLFHLYGRPYHRGLIHGIPTDFISSTKIRKQDPISLRMCCSDLNNFDPDRMLIKTQLGLGEVDTATYNDPTEVLTLNLVFD